SSVSSAKEPARFTSFTRCRRENRLHDCTGLAAGFGPRHPVAGIARSCPGAVRLRRGRARASGNPRAGVRCQAAGLAPYEFFATAFWIGFVLHLIAAEV